MKKMSLLLVVSILLVLCACGVQNVVESAESETATVAESISSSVAETPVAAEVSTDENEAAQPSAEESEAAEPEVSTQEITQLSAEDALISLQESGLPIERILVYDENTDLNGGEIGSCFGFHTSLQL